LPSAYDLALGKEFLSFFNFFAEYHKSDTRQRIFSILLFLNYFAECQESDTRQRISLPSASILALGKEFNFFFLFAPFFCSPTTVLGARF
jgi:hypothetical protein